jgi:hypothetical protein
MAMCLKMVEMLSLRKLSQNMASTNCPLPKDLRKKKAIRHWIWGAGMISSGASTLNLSMKCHIHWRLAQTSSQSKGMNLGANSIATSDLKMRNTPTVNIDSKRHYSPTARLQTSERTWVSLTESSKTNIEAIFDASLKDERSEWLQILSKSKTRASRNLVETFEELPSERATLNRVQQLKRADVTKPNAHLIRTGQQTASRALMPNAAPNDKSSPTNHDD